MFLKHIFGHKGILGINARNLLYLKPYNPKKAIKLADDKIKTKQFLSTRGIPVPKLYNIIKTTDDLEKFDFNTLPASFVVKPNNGYGGEGIIPIVEKKDNYWITASGNKITETDLKDHINDILDGRFSISNLSDFAFFEQLIIADDLLAKYSYKGLPDIRVVAHNLIPVMAMLRLPTRESNGKANLHLGAVGVGIDIAKGQTTYMAYKDRIINELPDDLGKIKGLQIPFWDEILTIASRVQLITNLGFLAADICIDKYSGPVLLEINARAGLGVQIANLAPLRKRLERIEGVKVTNPTKGVRIAKDMFGNIMEKEIQSVTGKRVITTKEDVEIIQKKGTTKIEAKIDTGKERTIIDEDFAKRCGFLDSENYEDETSTLKIKFSIKGKRIQTIADVEKIPSKEHKMIIGRRDLSEFLIDTSEAPKKKKFISENSRLNIKKTNIVNFKTIDQQLINIDNKIKLLYHLRPINLKEEEAKFTINNNYNPQFEYPQLKFDPLELIDELNKIKIDNSPLGILFEEKIQEIENKIHLLESIDEEEFVDYSIILFGKPGLEDVDKCKRLIKKIDFETIKKKAGQEIYNSEDLKKEFEKVFQDYGLKNWKVKIKENMVANCVAGKNDRLFVKEDAKFTSDRIKALIIHEIETHILTAENGKMQAYEIFNRGLPNYLETQEGLAMYNVEKQLKEPFSQNYKALGLVLAIEKALKSSFAETYAYLREFRIPKQQAFRATLKAKRGLMDTGKQGAFTKDYIYYKGYHEIVTFVEKGGDIKDLYIGKLNLHDLETAKKIPNIKKALIIPIWLKK